MARDALIELLYQAWADLDYAIEGLVAADAETRLHGLSRVAWTVGHVGQQVDSWFNVRFASGTPHPLLSGPMFHTGSAGDSLPWNEVLAATAEVRGMAREYLETLRPEDTDRVVPYTGGIDYLRPTGLKLSYALMRTATHHAQHTGEILTVRSLLGHRTEDSRRWGEALM